MVRNLCNRVVFESGNLIPLIILPKEENGTGLCNPSIYNDNGRLVLNLRHVNYTLYHCENGQLFNNRYGPLSYLNPENDVKLRTWNYYCVLNNDFTIKKCDKVDTSLHDIPPVWEFIGLEDARLFRWDGRLYMCGCRRDVKPNGESRMELSEIEITEEMVKEISRKRIQPPNDPNSYCEKNWMPVLDMPYHFVKWTNPTEVIQVNPEECSSKTVFLSHEKIENIGDLRGSSQVINWGEYRVCVVHEVALWKNRLKQKDAKYTHRFVVWDKEWNIVKISDKFSFMDGEIEFCCGMTLYKNRVLITFGFQDNAAFIIEGDRKIFESFIGIEMGEEKKEKLEGFAPLYCISYEGNEKRREVLLEQLEKHNTTGVYFEVATKESDNANKVTGKFVSSLSPRSVNVAVSHLKTIRRWLNTSTSPYAIFVEDDISLKTVDYWNFTWMDFMNNLPDDWDCVQLGCINENIKELKLKKRDEDVWSAMAYMLTRDYAKRLINMYCPNGEFKLEIPDSNIQPHIENLLYHMGNTYSISAFVENTDFKSNLTDRAEVEKHDVLHRYSHDLVMELWQKEVQLW